MAPLQSENTEAGPPRGNASCVSRGQAPGPEVKPRSPEGREQTAAAFRPKVLARGGEERVRAKASRRGEAAVGEAGLLPTDLLSLPPAGLGGEEAQLVTQKRRAAGPERGNGQRKPRLRRRRWSRVNTPSCTCPVSARPAWPTGHTHLDACFLPFPLGSGAKTRTF